MGLLSFLRDIITSIVAVIGAYVALSGLSAWKKQLLWKYNHELSRKFLRAVYKVRDGVSYVRSPVISIGEQVEAGKKMGLSEEESLQNHDKAVENVYNIRWQEVAKAWSDLEVESLEAEVSWGKEAKIIQKNLKDCVTKLRINVMNYLKRLPELRADYKILYGSMDESDEFDLEVNSAIKKIEVFLEPYLKQK